MPLTHRFGQRRPSKTVVATISALVMLMLVSQAALAGTPESAKPTTADRTYRLSVEHKAQIIKDILVLFLAIRGRTGPDDRRPLTTPPPPIADDALTSTERLLDKLECLFTRVLNEPFERKRVSTAELIYIREALNALDSLGLMEEGPRRYKRKRPNAQLIAVYKTLILKRIEQPTIMARP